MAWIFSLLFSSLFGLVYSLSGVNVVWSSFRGDLPIVVDGVLVGTIPAMSESEPMLPLLLNNTMASQQTFLYNISVNTLGPNNIWTWFVEPHFISGEVGYLKARRLPITFECLSSGTANGNVAFGIDGAENVVVIPFSKTCNTNQTRPDVTINFCGNNQKCTFVNSNSVVVNKGSVNPSWQINSNDPLSFTMNPLDNSYFQMSVSNGAQAFAVTVDDDSDAGASVYYNSPVTAQGSSVFKVNYTRLIAGSSLVTVVVTMDPYGPLSFIFSRKLVLSPIPVNSNDEGWSAAGIFFFVVFILGLFAYFGGCIYKYVKLDARGWDILPFIEFYRSVYYKCCGETKPYESVDGTRGVSVSNSHPANSSSKKDAPFSSYQTL